MNNIETPLMVLITLLLLMIGLAGLLLALIRVQRQKLQTQIAELKQITLDHKHSVAEFYKSNEVDDAEEINKDLQRVYWSLSERESIRELVKNYLVTHNMTMSDLAIIAGTSGAHVGRLLNGLDKDFYSTHTGDFNRVLSAVGLRLVIVRKSNKKWINHEKG